MIGYPILNGSTVPEVGQIPSASDAPLAFASQYRTFTGRDIVAAVSGQIATAAPNGQSTVELNVWNARTYLSSQYGTSTGQLMDVTGGVVSLVAEGVSGYAVQYDASGLPIVSSTTADGQSTGQDADLWWLYRNFGRR